MFELHIAYSLQLLVLAACLMLIYLGTKQASQLLRIGGYVLTVLTVLNMLCTLYYGVRYWEEGYFRTLDGRRGLPMSKTEGGMGMDCPMMKKMMEQKMMDKQKDTSPEAAPSSEDHEAHH
ncbi:MAG TPA: hypothetical protein VFX30_09180 [bacterium]|nr:hypothetical protein [bacterium]